MFIRALYRSIKQAALNDGEHAGLMCDSDRRLLTSSKVSFASGATTDAFGRLRISEPFTIFDSKQLHNNQPLFWDDAETSGTGTSSAHSSARASTTISVSATTAGKRVRQSLQRFNYQPGKSQLVFQKSPRDFPSWWSKRR